MTNQLQGRSLELFFIDGKPDGMQTAEEINWTGHVLLAPSINIVNALKRIEAQYTGVYLLLGESENGESKVYVGESENMSKRIRQHIHDGEKDWWTKVAFITTKGDGLNKAHVRYLEVRLLEIAHKVNRAVLANATQPNSDSSARLNEAGRNSMEVFLDTLMMVLPAMRIDCFLDQSRQKKEASASGKENPVFTLDVKGNQATAVVEDGEFVVQEKSHATANWTNSKKSSPTYARIHKELLQSGILKKENGYAIFTKNYAFTSTSAAAAVVAGYNMSGPKHWKHKKSGQTFEKWQDKNLENTLLHKDV